MSKGKRALGMNVGSASIVMIFAVLCLTIFSTLSFVTAHHEQNLARKSAQAVQQYYQADWQCEARYQEILEQLRNGVQPADLNGVEVTPDGGGYRICYAEPIDEQQQLEVSLYYKETELTIEQWNATAIHPWEYSEDIAVWDGEQEANL